MEKETFTINIFEDLDHKGRQNLAMNTSNRGILIVLSEDSWEYVKGQVVQNINTPIYILKKMLEEYDEVDWLDKNESFYSGYTKENIEKTLKLIRKKLGKEEFKKMERIESIIHERFGTFNI
jgi:hypothetical protein